MATAKAMGLWRRSGVPQRQAQKVMQIEDESISKDWTLLYERWKEKLKLSGRLLIFTGDRGCGKTQMGVSLVGATCSREKACKYHTANELFRRLRSPFDDDSDDKYHRLMDELGGRTRDETVELLVIDEIHECKGSDWETHTLRDIIDARYTRELSTILISNESPEEVVASLGESITDRCRETGAIIPFRWGSFRKQLREANENDNV